MLYDQHSYANEMQTCRTRLMTGAVSKLFIALQSNARILRNTWGKEVWVRGLDGLARDGRPQSQLSVRIHADSFYTFGRSTP